MRWLLLLAPGSRCTGSHCQRALRTSVAAPSKALPGLPHSPLESTAADHAAVGGPGCVVGEGSEGTGCEGSASLRGEAHGREQSKGGRRCLSDAGGVKSGQTGPLWHSTHTTYSHPSSTSHNAAGRSLSGLPRPGLHTLQCTLPAPAPTPASPSPSSHPHCPRSHRSLPSALHASSLLRPLSHQPCPCCFSSTQIALPLPGAVLLPPMVPHTLSTRHPPSFLTMLLPRSFSQSAAVAVGSCAPPPVVELKLAQTGEGIAECELLQWFVQEGDEVKQFELVCQVQSDKATVDITSRYGGRIVRTHFVPGDIVKVGETLADILTAPSASASPKEAPARLAAEGLAEDSVAGSEEGGQADVGRDSSCVLATPAVRHLARTYGVKLSEVEGTGKGGRVMKEDLLTYVAVRQGVEEEVRMEEEAFEGSTQEQSPVLVPAAASPRPPSFPPLSAPSPSLHEPFPSPSPAASPDAAASPVQPEPNIIPIRGYRRAMVKAMAQATSIPHFNFMDEFDVTPLSAVLAKANSALSPPSSLTAAAAAAAVEGKSESLEGKGGAVRLTHLSFLVKALSVALLEYPEMNATVDPDVTEIRCSRSHNIGIAMATPHGLVVPNVKHCEQRTIHEIAAEIVRLRQLASRSQLSAADLADGTISVSNIGSLGGTYACPLVFQPQLAIVALGRARTLPRFDSQGAVAPASILNVSWAADHRVVDGAMLAGLSLAWKRLVEHPELLMLALK